LEDSPDGSAAGADLVLKDLKFRWQLFERCEQRCQAFVSGQRQEHWLVRGVADFAQAQAMHA
jgi:hypothetical protein